MRGLVFTLLLILLCAKPLEAQGINTTAATNRISSASSSLFSAQDLAIESASVPVPEPSAKAVQHYRTGNVCWFAWRVWQIALPAIFLFSGFSARLRDFSRRVGRNWYFTLCLYFAVVAVANYCLEFPLIYYTGFVRPHSYGLSDQLFSKWFADTLKELAIMLVGGVTLLWVPYWAFKKFSRRWWLLGGLAAIPFYCFVQMISPVVIDPMFNDFTPVKNKVLEAKILALAERAGIHGSRVYEVNKSVDTKTVNAYVTGFMGTKRIVLWDTILAKLDDRELMFVMGHEMGHFVLGHVVKGIAVLSVLTVAGFYGVHRISTIFLRRWSSCFGFDQLSDIASLPLIFLLLNLFSLVLTPIGFACSRHMEHEADRFGLELTHYNHSAATGFTRLLDEDLSVPWPGIFFTIWRGTHPSIGERIEFFNHYKPWEHGQPSKYEQYFKDDAAGKTLANPMVNRSP